MENMDAVYRKYARYVYQYLLAQTHDPELSEELTQETFCQAIRSIDRFDGKCRISTWLCAIAKNCLRTWHRRHPPILPLETEDEEGNTANVLDRISHEESSEEEALQKEGRAAVLAVIHRMREPYREVLYLRAFAGLSFREVGELFGKSENWARVTYYRSKEQLGKELESV